MLTILVPSRTRLVCSASSANGVKASRPQASAIQMAWIPASSASLPRSIKPRQSTFPSHPIPIVSLGAIRICSLACTRRSGRYHFDGKRASQLGRCVWELAAGCCRLAITQPGAEAAMPEFDLKDKAAIAGAGNSPYGRRLGRSPIDLAAEAIANALDDAGLRRDELDGMIVSFGSPLGADVDTLAPLLGLKLRAYSQTWAHGRFTASCTQWAAMMVNTGFANAVACLGSWSLSHIQRPKFGGSGDREGAREAGGGHGEDPVFGMTSPGAGAALVARRYFERYGADSRELAAVP